MEKITRLDKGSLGMIRTVVDAALAIAAEDLGLSIETGRISYGDSNATIAVKVAVIGEAGTALTKEATDFTRMAHLYGLKPEDLGRTFEIRGRGFKLTGLKPRSPKFPFIAEEVGTGRSMKLTEKSVVSALGHEVATT